MRRGTAAWSSTLLLLCLMVVDAKRAYTARLPNGANVEGVHALGHRNPSGGGGENQFGKDFDGVGQSQWNVALCERDSDGDGQTNGQELGDPCCLWDRESNAEPLWTDGVSDPGDESFKSDPTKWAALNCTNLTLALGATTTNGAGGSGSSYASGSGSGSASAAAAVELVVSKTGGRVAIALLAATLLHAAFQTQAS